MAFVFLILVFFIDCGGYLISIAYCPFFHFKIKENNFKDVEISQLLHKMPFFKKQKKCENEGV